MLTTYNLVKTADEVGIFILLPRYERVQQAHIEVAIPVGYKHMKTCTCVRCIKHWTTYYENFSTRLEGILRARTLSRYKRHSTFDTKLPMISRNTGQYGKASARSAPAVTERNNSPEVENRYETSNVIKLIQLPNETNIDVALEKVSAGEVHELQFEQRSENIVSEEQSTGVPILAKERRKSSVNIEQSALKSCQRTSTVAEPRLSLSEASHETMMTTTNDKSDPDGPPSEVAIGIAKVVDMLNAEEEEIMVQNPNFAVDKDYRIDAAKNWQVLKAVSTIAGKLRRGRGTKPRRKLSLRRTISILNVIKPLLQARAAAKLVRRKSRSSKLESLVENESSNADAENNKSDADVPPADQDTMKLFIKATATAAVKNAFTRILKEKRNAKATKGTEPTEVAADEEESNSDDELSTNSNDSENESELETEQGLELEAAEAPAPVDDVLTVLVENVQSMAAESEREMVDATSNEAAGVEKKSAKRKKKHAQSAEASEKEKPVWREIATIVTQLSGQQRLRLVNSIALDLRRFTNNGIILKKMKRLHKLQQDRQQERQLKEEKAAVNPRDTRAYRYVDNANFIGPFANGGLSWNFFEGNARSGAAYKGLPDWAKSRYALDTGPRFTLPTELRQLENMTPMDYLTRHCVVQSDRILMYHKAFSVHRKAGEPWLTFEGFKAAIKGLYGSALSAADFDNIFKIVRLDQVSSPNYRMDFKTFVALSGFVERLFQKRLSRSKEYFKDEIERVDFYTFSNRMKDMQVDENLNKLFDLLRC